MPDKKIVFIAFAIEDQRSRDLLKGQSLHARSPFEYIDMSVKEAYSEDWKGKVRTRIKRSHGVIALISKNSIKSSGQRWEIQCALEESKPIIGVWAYSDDHSTVPGLRAVVWTWDNIKRFIDSL